VKVILCRKSVLLRLNPGETWREPWITLIEQSGNRYATAMVASIPRRYGPILAVMLTTDGQPIEDLSKLTGRLKLALDRINQGQEDTMTRALQRWVQIEIELRRRNRQKPGPKPS
jgi:hypothetical protein